MIGSGGGLWACDEGAGLREGPAASSARARLRRERERGAGRDREGDGRGWERTGSGQETSGAVPGLWHLSSADSGTVTLGKAGESREHLRRCTERLARRESPQMVFRPWKLEGNKSYATSLMVSHAACVSGPRDAGKAVPEGWHHPGSAVPVPFQVAQNDAAFLGAA